MFWWTLWQLKSGNHDPWGIRRHADWRLRGAAWGGVGEWQS